MDEHGRKLDVLILDCFFEDQKTGLKIMQENQIIVWADEEMKSAIAKTPGVTNVYNHSSPSNFNVYLDPRYDREFVKKEIEANILCGQ